jgi:predicted nucleotidyltransferase
MTPLAELAEDLGTTERTLRRLVAVGLIRASRPTPRKISIAVGERVYLRKHWDLFTDLRSALRNEHNVRAAILFGSTARGSSHENSDLDIAVVLAKPGPVARLDLQRRLEDRLHTKVQIMELEAIQRQPELWRQVQRDGRPIVDRDGLAREILSREVVG